MNYKEMKALFWDLLKDAHGDAEAWQNLDGALINEGLVQTMRLLPPEELRILKKEAVKDAKKDIVEYGIEGTPFFATDFVREIAVWLTDGTILRPCTPVDREFFGSTNRFFKGTLYKPRCAVIPLTTDAKKHAILVDPTPVADKTGGLKLVYQGTGGPLSGDADTWPAPTAFHVLPVYHAVSIARAKDGSTDGTRFWTMWIDRLKLENARWGRQIVQPSAPTAGG